jgi:holo-[acyl-carrier protein] synthase
VTPATAQGVGIDLVEIARVERALERRPRLAARLFSSRELSYARARRRPGRHLAARFAAKEAAIKALAPGGVAPAEVEVLGGSPPRLELHGRAAAAARARGVELEVSLTHSRELAAAVVIARRSESTVPRGAIDSSS